MIRIDNSHKPEIKIVNEIKKIENECFRTPWSVTSIENQLAYEHCLFVADYTDEVMNGYVIGQSVVDECELFRIAVMPQSRRQGIADKLMKSFIDECVSRNIKKIFLEVRVSNSPAISLYERFGFSRIFVRKNYYESPTEDAAIYQLILD